MWLTLIASPVSGSGIRHSSANSCWQVEDPRQAVGGALQLRVGGDVVDALVAEPHLAVAGAQALQELLPVYVPASYPPY